MPKPELKITLTLKDAVTKSLTGVKQKFSNMARSIKSAFLPVTIAVGATTAAIGAVVKQAVAYGVKLDEMSKQAQVTTEEFSRLAYAADQEHASLETLTKVFPLLTKYMEYARQGQITYSREFDKMGVKVTDATGKLKSTYNIFLEMADYYKKAEDKTKALAIATTLLGRRGAELVPLLRLGREGIAQLGDEAEKLGLVMDQETAAAMKAFDDKLVAIKGGLRGAGISITKELLPYLDKLAKKIEDTDWEALGEGLTQGIDTAIRKWKELEAVVLTVTLGYTRVEENLARIGIGLRKIMLAPWVDKEGAARQEEHLEYLIGVREALRDIVLEKKADIDLGEIEIIAPVEKAQEVSDAIVDIKQQELEKIRALGEEHIVTEEAKIAKIKDMWIMWQDEKIAGDMARLQAETEFYKLAVDTQKKAHQSMWIVVGKARDTFSTGVSKMFVDMTKGTLDLKKSMKALGEKMVQILIDFAVQKAVNFALGKVMMAGQVAASTAAGAATAAAWAPAAAMVSLASFGSNAVPASAALIETSALAQVLAIPGMEKGGEVEYPGSVLVGERGPEILTLPQGAVVSPLSEKKAATIEIEINYNHFGDIRTEEDKEELFEELGESIKNAIRSA